MITFEICPYKKDDLAKPYQPISASSKKPADHKNKPSQSHYPNQANQRKNAEQNADPFEDAFTQNADRQVYRFW